MPLDEAHLGGLFCRLWINKYTLKKYLLASGLDVAMVAAEGEFFRRTIDWNSKSVLFCSLLISK